MTKRLLFVVNTADFFLSHRLPVALAARDDGYVINVATAPGEAAERIRQYGLTHHAVSLSRSGKNPFAELASVWSLLRLMRRVKPDVVHLVTIKPVLYGGVAARAARVPAVVAAISGMGSVFIAQSLEARILRGLVQSLYRLALGHKNLKVIFQNPDDEAVLVGAGAVNPAQTARIKGSGVALGDYPFVPEPEGVPVVSLAVRLLKDKGVGEFVAAARQLKACGVQARFWLIGSSDPGNPATVTESELQAWCHEGVVELLGYKNDISVLFSKSNIVVLPSYREGFPKVLIEAAACGRAVVTTDAPGCRDAIEPGRTGVLVPVRDAMALADAIEALINNTEKRRAMGRAGRALAEREFSIEKVVEAHLEIYRELLSSSGSR